MRAPIRPDGWACGNAVSRRSFLAWLAAALCCPAIQANALFDGAALQRAVALRVRERELLSDAITPFRAGGAERIDAAMQQYVEVFASTAPPTPSRLLALRWTLNFYLSADAQNYGRWRRSEHARGSVTSFGNGDHKCNKLVADAYAVGAGAGLSVGTDWFSEGAGTGWPAMQQGDDLWPPQSNQLANPAKNIRSLTDARDLRQPGEAKANPELGDVIAFPAAVGSGHVGLYLGRNLIVSAKETGIEIGPVEVESAAHGGIARIRKFTGSGR